MSDDERLLEICPWLRDHPGRFMDAGPDGECWIGAEGSHRRVWADLHGDPGTFVSARSGMRRRRYILHSCDTWNCWRPSHLSVGLPGENRKQFMERGRFRIAYIEQWARLETLRPGVTRLSAPSEMVQPFLDDYRANGLPDHAKYHVNVRYTVDVDK